MFLSNKDPSRRVVPRWRSLSDFVDGRGLEQADKSLFPAKEVEQAFEKAIYSWERAPSTITAIEVLAAASISNKRGEAFTKATEYLKNASVRQFSLSVDNFECNSTCEISELRKSLRDYPNDPLKWIRLARAYTLIGLADSNSKAAVRAVRTAVALAPDDRYILRCATRFFLHIDSPEEAIWVLTRSKRTKLDPWLASALLSSREIANVPHQNIRMFKSLAANTNWSDRARTELQSALGSLAIDSGNIRAGKKHYKDALLDPNENVLAQTIWTQESRKVALTSKPLELESVSKSFEAKALEFRRSKEWQKMMTMCLHWQRDEPYSTRPASMGSHIALTLRENVEEACQLLSLANQSNPNDLMLKNNLAFAYAISGEIEKAQKEFATVSGYKKDSSDGSVFNATQGLIYFRNGNLASGRAHYKSSIEYFEKNKLTSQLINCKCQYAMEEIRIGNVSQGVKIYSEIEYLTNERSKSAKTHELEHLISKIRLLLGASKSPSS